MRISLQGVAAAEQQFGKAAAKIADGELEPAAVVEMSAAAVALQANVAVVRTADELEKELVEVSSGA